MRAFPKKTDALWFKDAIFYELHVRSFFDSDNDGIGDLKGIIQKLDYLEDLGVDTIWLLPFYPSPLKDDGYDVTDHYDVHPDYGNLGDFKSLLKESHKRGIRVIVELILNHTSDQHPWFRKARKSKAGSRFHDYYVWSANPDKFREARVIFPKEENSNWTYDDEAGAYYWHRYYHHQPELNFSNPEVQLEMIKVADFWLKLGVDGFRLPAVAFLFEEEGTNCENLPQTHAFLKRLRSHIDKHYKNRILIAEANLWPEEAATYFGNADECHMNFHYPLMPRLFLALRTEDSYPIIDILEQTPPTPDSNQWALFLRNHDEMGLETVSEEEKDYLFKTYANDKQTKFNAGIRRRLAPLVDNDRRRIELLYTLLFSLPGTPVLYYGDEIGMGDNVFLGDRFGVRTPMQWNMNMNAGFSQANPQRLFLPVIQDPVFRHESVNVSNQEQNPSSLLWWIKHTIGMRKKLKILGHGELRFRETSNSKVIAFSRSHQDQHVIVVANLSQFPQAARIDLSQFKDYDITEVFSQNRFMKANGTTCPVTMSPYGYFWFQADKADRREQPGASGELPLLKTDVSWEKFFDNYQEVRILERKVFSLFIQKCRWFGGKAKVISKTLVHQAIPVKVEGDTHFLVILEIHYVQRLPEYYFLPLVFVEAESIGDEHEYTTQSIVCRAEIQDQTGFIMDSSYDADFRNFLFLSMEKDYRLKDEAGQLEFNSGVFVKLEVDNIESKILKADQSNTAIIYSDKYFFKFYRRIEKDINPDLEIIRYFTENTRFHYAPKYAGSVQYRDDKGDTMVLGLLQEKVENQGDAWGMTQDAVSRYFDRVLALRDFVFPELVERPVLSFEEVPPAVRSLIGKEFYQHVALLGQRTAEMHKALASGDVPAFKPEPVNQHYQRSLYSSLRKLLKSNFSLLENSLPSLDPSTRNLAKEILSLESVIIQAFAEVYTAKLSSMKIRIHGDYHLGQVLFTGDDFMIIDFEGEPGLSFSERRLKKSPLKDVAGMMRSFHYAAYGKILLSEEHLQADQGILDTAAAHWQHYVSRFFFGSYIRHAEAGMNLSEEYNILIRTFLLEKAIYELGYELNARPDWVKIPLKGISYLVNRYIQEQK